MSNNRASLYIEFQIMFDSPKIILRESTDF